MALGVDARRLVVGAGLPLAVFASRILLILVIDLRDLRVWGIASWEVNGFVMSQ
ncbi:hypothetical protein SAMN05216404_11724 [Nitrosospira multiformis]|uniref:Uncharacterized protein n=1 Tax=Nitrosospira multiformis TaxID=1231 RepID=A0A1H8NNM4_9PROT|nr:hypothetical protein SAMN05216404_11724 [Nitrosospira multiformis]